MKRLRISADLGLPAHEAQTQTFVVYGGKGMGKTNFGAVLAEELAANDLRFAWFDPVGVAWGLKHSSDGRGEGIGVLTLGGAHGGIPILPTAGAVVADLVVDEDVSVIVDVSRHANGTLWTNGEKIRFARDYFLRLYQRQGERKRPLMQIVDEAGRFVPQDIPRGAVDIMECVGAIEQLVELGRNVGVGVCLITQRSARMRKSVSELAEIMLAFRTVGPRSLSAIEDWFEEHIERKHALELRNRIRELERGTAMIVSPGWLKVEGEYAIRARETFDSSATPVAGKERRPSGRGARVDLAHYEARMAETIEQAKADDPKELQRRLREAEKYARELDEKVKVLESVRGELSTEHVAELELALRAEISKRDDIINELEGKLDESLGLDGHLQLLSLTLDELHDLGERATVGMRKIREGEEARLGERTRLGVETFEPPALPEPRPRAEQGDQRAPKEGQPRATATAAALGPRARPAPPAAAVDDGEPLGEGDRKVLDALAQFPDGKTVNEVAFLAGYSAGASTIRNIFARLRKRGFIEDGQPIRPTAAGLAAVGGPVDRPTGPALLDVWLRHPRMGESDRGVLLALIDFYPDEPTLVELCEVTGHSPTASTIRNILARLRKLGLVEKSRRRVPDEFMEAIR